VSSCRISHLGMKPVIGGRPPRDRRASGAMAVKTGPFAHDVARVLMVVALFNLNRMNVENVMIR